MDHSAVERAQLARAVSDALLDQGFMNRVFLSEQEAYDPWQHPGAAVVDVGDRISVFLATTDDPGSLSRTPRIEVGMLEQYQLSLFGVGFEVSPIQTDGNGLTWFDVLAGP